MTTQNTMSNQPWHKEKFNQFASIVANLIENTGGQIKVEDDHAIQVKLAHRSHSFTYGVLNQTMKSVRGKSHIRIHFNDTSDEEFESIKSSIEKLPFHDSTFNNVNGIEISTFSMNEDNMKELAHAIHNAL
jgi:predicted PilT family ATPase